MYYAVRVKAIIGLDCLPRQASRLSFRKPVRANLHKPTW